MTEKKICFLHEMTEEEIAREEAWQRECIMRNEASYRNALRLAREEGEKKKEREMTFRLFNMHQSFEFIGQVVGISIEQVEKYHKEYLDNNKEL